MVNLKNEIRLVAVSFFLFGLVVGLIAAGVLQ